MLNQDHCLKDRNNEQDNKKSNLWSSNADHLLAEAPPHHHLQVELCGRKSSSCNRASNHLTTAGCATILPRQPDNVFRPQSCLIWQYYYIQSGYSIQTPRLKYFSHFFCTLRFYYVVAKLKNCRVPRYAYILSFHNAIRKPNDAPSTKILSKQNGKTVFYATFPAC